MFTTLLAPSSIVRIAIVSVLGLGLTHNVHAEPVTEPIVASLFEPEVGQAPEVLAVQPVGSSLNKLQPTLIVQYKINSGDALDPTKMRFLINGQDVTSKMQMTSTALTYRPERPFTRGIVNAEVQLVNQEGLTMTYPWSFCLN